MLESLLEIQRRYEMKLLMAIDQGRHTFSQGTGGKCPTWECQNTQVAKGSSAGQQKWDAKRGFGSATWERQAIGLSCHKYIKATNVKYDA